MTASRIWWWLTTTAAQRLSPCEADAVLGDLAEGEQTGAEALRDVLGLVMRRYARRWHSWRPWAAGFGIALPTALVTMGASLALSREFIHTIATPSIGPVAIALLGARALSLLLWAWLCGVSLQALSRDTLGASTALAILPCLFCLSRYHDAVLPFTSLVFLLPALLAGAHFGRARNPLEHRSFACLAGGVSVSVALLGGVSVLWTWPAWYLVLATRRATHPPAL